MSRLELAGMFATCCVLMFIVIAAIHVVQRPAAPLAPERTSSTSMPSYCEGQVRVFPGLGVAYDPTCVAPAP